MKEIYILPIQEAELISSEYCLGNFPVRLERANRFRFREDRLRCIGAGALLCGIAGIKESDIMYNDYGKPLCDGKNFSISHSGDYTVLALSDGIVGVDIEEMSRKRTDISARVCQDDELIWLEGATDEQEKTERFYRLWTLKESIMKAEGRGLSMDPRSYSVLPLVENGSVRIGEMEYFGDSIVFNGYMLAVCGDTPEKEHITHITAEMI